MLTNNLNDGGGDTSPIVDASAALRKLTSGGTLTAAERAVLNMGPAPVAQSSGTFSSDAAVTKRQEAEAAAAKAKAEADAKAAAEAEAAAKTAAELKAAKDAAAAAEAARIKAEAELAASRNANNAAIAANTAATQALIAQQNAAASLAASNAAKDRENAITVLKERFAKYGLSSLAAKIQELAIDGASEATITISLQETPEYKARFKANDVRLKNNLRVLTPAEYLAAEDGYRQVLRSYGLKQFDTDEYVSQFISNDVSPTELSDRVTLAVQRVQNADPAVSQTLRDYYGIGQNDLVAYMLDPNQQITKIQRQVAAAEVGTAARIQGLETGVGVAEQLAAQGITQAQAQKGYATIADILPSAEKLSAIYGKTADGYGQSEAEQEVFNSLASAQRKRQKLTALEVAQFSGSSGMAKGLTTKSAGQI